MLAVSWELIEIQLTNLYLLYYKASCSLKDRSLGLLFGHWHCSYRHTCWCFRWFSEFHGDVQPPRESPCFLFRLLMSKVRSAEKHLRSAAFAEDFSRLLSHLPFPAPPRSLPYLDHTAGWLSQLFCMQAALACLFVEERKRSCWGYRERITASHGHEEQKRRGCPVQ